MDGFRDLSSLSLSNYLSSVSPRLQFSLPPLSPQMMGTGMGNSSPVMQRPSNAEAGAVKVRDVPQNAPHTLFLGPLCASRPTARPTARRTPHPTPFGPLSHQLFQFPAPQVRPAATCATTQLTLPEDMSAARRRGSSSNQLLQSIMRSMHAACMARRNSSSATMHATTVPASLHRSLPVSALSYIQMGEGLFQCDWRAHSPPQRSPRPSIASALSAPPTAD